MKAYNGTHRAAASKSRLRRLNPCQGSTAGTTFIEIMIATAVFASGIVSIMGGVMTLASHRQMSDQRAVANSLAGSAFENLRGLSLNNILTYDIPVDHVNTNTVDLPGVGQVTVGLFAVIPGVNNAAPTFFELGVDNVADLNLASVPNPVEIQAVITPYPASDESHPQYSAATLLTY